MSKNDSSPTKRRSILRNPDDKTKKKKLSFKQPEDVNDELEPPDPSTLEVSGAKNKVNKVFLAESLKITDMGICYDPSPYEEINQESDRISIGILDRLSNPGQRLDFRRILNHSENLATVMIVGECFITSGFQRELEKVVDSTLKLKYVCKDHPSTSDALDSDFFIFLVQLDTLESIDSLRERLKHMNQPMSLLCKRSAIVAITSPSGRYANIIPVEVLHDFLAESQMSCFTFSVETRDLRLGCVKRIYEKIKQCCSGNNISLLANWGLTCPVRSKDLLQF